MRSAIRATASMAATPSTRGTRYSDCNSAPTDGVNSSRKWGRRSYQGPYSPSWGVHGVGSMPAMGCLGPSAGRPPAATIPPTSGSPADFTQTWETTAGSCQVVNMLTLSPAPVTADRSARIASRRTPSNTHCATSRAGATSSSTCVRTPSAPSPTTAAPKPASPRARRTISPRPSTSSSADTWVASEPIRSPEPCVPVWTAPATEMCGSEARLASATPSARSAGTRSP